MFQYIDLHFHKGDILTQVMLTELAEYPREMLSLSYKNRQNALVEGTNIIKKGDEIWMEKGIVLYEGHLFRMTQDVSLSALVSQWYESGEGKIDTDCKILLCPEDYTHLEQRKGQIFHELVPRICKQSEELEGICLLQFNSSTGTLKLPVMSLSSETLKKYFKSSSFSMIQVPYTGRTGATYHPFIFEKMLEVLMGKKGKTAVDYMMIHEIMKNQVLELGWMGLLMEDLLGNADWRDMSSVASFDREKFLFAFLPCLQVEGSGEINQVSPMGRVNMTRRTPEGKGLS